MYETCRWELNRAGVFARHVPCSPAVLENEQDVVSKGVSVLLQDPTHIVKHLQRTWKGNVSLMPIKHRLDTQMNIDKLMCLYQYALYLASTGS